MDYIFYLLEKEWDENITTTFEVSVNLGTYRYYDGKLDATEQLHTTLKELIK